MRDIEGMMVRQSRIYRPDVLPFTAIQSASGMEILQKRFGFRDCAPDPSTGDLWLGSGLFALSEEQVVAIGQVSISSRRLVIEVLAESDIAILVFHSMAEVLDELDPEHRFSEAEPLVLTQETQCSVVLDFAWDDLLSDKLVRFVPEGLKDETNQQWKPPRLTGMNLRFTVQYEVQDEHLKDFGVSPMDRYFIIEPRQSTPLSKARYFTFSPFDSTRHLELVAELESLMGARAKKRQR